MQCREENKLLHNLRRELMRGKPDKVTVAWNYPNRLILRGETPPVFVFTKFSLQDKDYCK